MEQLSTLIIGAIVSSVTQASKKFFPQANPLISVGILALIAGMVYSFGRPLIPAEIVTKAAAGFATAVTLYELIKNMKK
jgi:hypothetical protein